LSYIAHKKYKPSLFLGNNEVLILYASRSKKIQLRVVNVMLHYYSNQRSQ